LPYIKCKMRLISYNIACSLQAEMMADCKDAIDGH
uniref:Uncharacterized protein n=1 Tax=Aegilops tauschii subsp. strangulata TaxID=200361 RepID=A0A453BCJ2_AEGTS